MPLPDRDLLVVLDEAVLDNQEDGIKLIWVFDHRVPATRSASRRFPRRQRRLQGQGRPFRATQHS